MTSLPPPRIVVGVEILGIVYGYGTMDLPKPTLGVLGITTGFIMIQPGR
jgi:hypothetical protein